MIDEIKFRFAKDDEDNFEDDDTNNDEDPVDDEDY